MSNSKAAKRINKYKSNDRKRRELLLVTWLVWKNIDKVFELFFNDVGFLPLVSDMEWLTNKISTHDHTWNLSTRLAQKLYFVTDGEFVKIGIARNIASRLSGIQTGNPRHLTVAYLSDITYARELEQILHKSLEHINVKGEWFVYNDEIKLIIKNLNTYEQNLKRTIINATAKATI